MEVTMNSYSQLLHDIFSSLSRPGAVFIVISRFKYRGESKLLIKDYQNGCTVDFNLLSSSHSLYVS